MVRSVISPRMRSAISSPPSCGKRFNKDIRDLDDQIRKGDFSELLAWLRKNIHQYGHKYEPQTLVQKVTGSKITPEPYVRYLTKKYSEIYGL